MVQVPICCLGDEDEDSAGGVGVGAVGGVRVMDRAGSINTRPNSSSHFCSSSSLLFSPPPPMHCNVSRLDRNDVSLPSHRWTNGWQQLKTIVANGWLIEQPSKNHWSQWLSRYHSINGNGHLNIARGTTDPEIESVHLSNLLNNGIYNHK